MVDKIAGEETIAAQEPIVLDQDIDEETFDDSDGLELAVVLRGERGEGGGVFAGDDLVAGVNSGLKSVHARDGFALFGARAGGEFCVAAISLNL